MTVKSLIVGLGKIGLGYDFYDSTDTFVASHAKALHLHSDFDLVAGVDPATDRREMFSRKYGKPAFESIDSALQHCSPELAIVATPIREHIGTFQQLLSFPSLRLILCEKPFAATLPEAERMLYAAKNRNISVAINYVRRYDPGIQILADRLCSGELGFPLKACVWFSKGIFNNGSHFVNLFSDVLGQVQDVKIVSRGRLWDKWDPEPDFRLGFTLGEVYFLAVREENFSYTQVEILGPKGKVLCGKDGRISWWGTMSDPNFHGYTILGETAYEIPTDLHRCQYNVLQNLGDFLSGRSRLFCDGHSGLKTMKVLDQIRDALK